MKFSTAISRKRKNTEHYNLLSETGEEFLREKKMPWQEYPRPQLRREKYFLLNGTWKCNGNDILVPFPPQSSLSGYEKRVEEILIYEKEFHLPEGFTEERILLHFGAVDQVARVWLNDTFLGTHEGGYLPFSFDITKAADRQGENRLKVEAVDTLSKDYPYGKQTSKPGGMWYTPVSGIWQTVWLEAVPSAYIEKLILTPDLSGVDIEVVINGGAPEEGVKEVTADGGSDNRKKDEGGSKAPTGFTVTLQLDAENVVTQNFEGSKGRLEVEGKAGQDGSCHRARLWTPDEPYLYTLRVTVGKDMVDSYFALRTVAIEERRGINRVVLNGRPVFLHGVLDQGYFCDGLFLPAKAEEYEKDVLRMKELGCNLLRKHIKVEPEAFYYACDRLGILVLQDMVNNGPYSFIFDTALPTLGFKKRKERKGPIEGKRKLFFREHTRQTIEHLYNHPCIVAYTVFNEGWGQFNSDEMYDYVKKLDPTRLANSTSGWFAQQKNDFDSEHIYFKVIPLTVKKRPLFVSECGGYTLSVENHHYSKDTDYGYGRCSTPEELTGKILDMYKKMILPSIKDGLCGCIYTQLSDVEEEINGLYTYDRKVCKVKKTDMQKMAEEMYKALEDF